MGRSKAAHGNGTARKGGPQPADVSELLSAENPFASMEDSDSDAADSDADNSDDNEVFEAGSNERSLDGTEL